MERFLCQCVLLPKVCQKPDKNQTLAIKAVVKHLKNRNISKVMSTRFVFTMSTNPNTLCSGGIRTENSYWTPFLVTFRLKIVIYVSSPMSSTRERTHARSTSGAPSSRQTRGPSDWNQNVIPTTVDDGIMEEERVLLTHTTSCTSNYSERSSLPRTHIFCSFRVIIHCTVSDY